MQTWLDFFDCRRLFCAVEKCASLWPDSMWADYIFPLSLSPTVSVLSPYFLPPSFRYPSNSLIFFSFQIRTLIICRVSLSI